MEHLRGLLPLMKVNLRARLTPVSREAVTIHTPNIQLRLSGRLTYRKVGGPSFINGVTIANVTQ